jgi:DNA processing protein
MLNNLASPACQVTDGELGDWLHLLHSPGVGRESARRLLSRFGSPRAAISADVVDLGTCVDAPTALSLSRPPEGHAERLANTLAWLHAVPSRRIMVLGDSDYPPLLLHTADPPLLLYMQGHTALLNQPSLAIVGSRKTSAQGLDHARAFARAISRQSWTIVSGLAAGIDGAAHEGALEGPGSTVAVIGTGIDRVYPASHRKLTHRIAESGLLVSEMALGTPPLAANFPQRNRLIAGLSRGTLVVEAALRSGSLITARLAAEAGREVMAIPGSVLSPHAAGCHALIREGAALVATPEEVLQELQALPSLEVLSTETSEAKAPAPQSEDIVLQAMGHDPVSLDMLIGRCGWGLHPPCQRT